MPQEIAPEAAAAWFAEAFETGNSLAPLPEGLAPRDRDTAEAIAAATLDALGIVPCGLRLLRRPGAAPLAGPMVEARLLAGGATVSLAAARHAAATAAVIGELAAPLDPAATTAPRLARLFPAVDVAASRFTAAPADELACIADLAGLGYVVAGRGMAMKPGPLDVALAPKGARRRGAPVDLRAAFAEAAAEARRWGGLPKGALLVVAGLTAPMPAEGVLRARLGALGAAEVAFAS
jgi:hypothetical protein